MNLVRGFSDHKITARRQNVRILACGPQEVTQSLNRTFNSKFVNKAASFDTLNTNNLCGFRRGWSRLMLSMNTAFILVFYLDDESSFQAISTFREAIVESKGEGVPLLVVGYNRSTSSPRIMGQETADCLFTIEWGCKYTELCEGRTEGIDGVLREILDVVKVKQCNNIQ